MKNLWLAVLLVVNCYAISACSMDDLNNAVDPTTNKSLLEDVSGVWRTSNDGTLITLNYSDKKFQMLAGENFVPVTLGAIDNVNDTVNLNVITNENKRGIWTIGRVWENAEKESFHLVLTLHDGSQDELSFVRAVTTDDLNRIASLVSAMPKQGNSIRSAINATSPTDEQPQAVQANPDAADVAQYEIAGPDGQPASGSTEQLSEPATAEEPLQSAVRSYTDEMGITYTVTENEYGTILDSDNARIYLGATCDVNSPNYGPGKWSWSNNGFAIKFADRSILFPGQHSPFRDDRCPSS